MASGAQKTSKSTLASTSIGFKYHAGVTEVSSLACVSFGCCPTAALFLIAILPDEQASANMLKVMWSMIMGKGRPVQFQRKDQRALGGNAFLDRQLVRSRLCDQVCVGQQVRDQAGRLLVVGSQAPGAAPISEEAALVAARADPPLAAKLSVFQSRR